LALSLLCEVVIVVLGAISAFLLLAPFWLYAFEPWSCAKTGMLLLGVFILLVDAAGVFFAVKRFRLLPPWLAAAALTGGLLAGALYSRRACPVVTCYLQALSAVRPHSRLLIRQQKLLGRFRERGTISEATYARVRSITQMVLPCRN